MTNKIKFIIILGIACFGLTTGLVIKAQEEASPTTVPDVTQEVALDENVSAQDLEVKEPTVLPDSPFYFLKDWVRRIRVTITFNKVKKAELENKYANEKLVELKKLTEKNADSETITKATENYKKATEKLKEVADKIKGTASENEEVDKFLDKFTKQQVLHEKILQKLETQVPAEVFEKIKEARENHLERFKEVMLKLENREKIADRLKKAIESQGGSEFKEFKYLEILEKIKEKMPEDVKEDIQDKIEGEVFQRLKEKIEALPAQKQEKLEQYLDKVSGDQEKRLEILESIRSTIKENTELKEKLKEVREKVLENVQTEPQPTRMCSPVAKPSADFCENGRITVKKDEQGCIVAFDCVIPAEEKTLPETPSLVPGTITATEITQRPQSCIALWDPVCGKDEKTYSNKCYASSAGIEVAYKGECKECETDQNCPPLPCLPATTSAQNCVNIKQKCVEGKCVVVPIKAIEGGERE